MRSKIASFMSFVTLGLTLLVACGSPSTQHATVLDAEPSPAPAPEDGAAEGEPASLDAYRRLEAIARGRARMISSVIIERDHQTTCVEAVVKDLKALINGDRPSYPLPEAVALPLALEACAAYIPNRSRQSSSNELESFDVGKVCIAKNRDFIGQYWVSNAVPLPELVAITEALKKCVDWSARDLEHRDAGQCYIASCSPAQVASGETVGEILADLIADIIGPAE